MSPLKGESNVTRAISVPSPSTSVIFSGMNQTVLEFLEENNATYYDHSFSVFVTTWNNFSMNNTFNLAATTVSASGVEYVAVAEHL